MKSNALRIAVLLMVLGASMCVAQQPAKMEAESPEAQARALLQELVTGKFEQAAARFSEAVANALPASKLAEVWRSLETQVGAFQEVTKVTQSEQQGYRIVVLTCRFQKTPLDLRVVFDASGKVSGLRFVPVEAPAANWTPSPAVKPDSFEERDVTVGVAPWTLPGKLCMPKGAGPFAAVVLVHGSGPNDADESIGANKVFKDIAWGLATRGIAALRYEKRTRQYGAQIASLQNLTVKEETIEDAQRAVELLAAQPGIDAKRIFVIGHSLGATLAPRIAVGSPHTAGIVVMAGITRPLEEVVVEQVEYLAKLDGNVSEAEQARIDSARAFAKAVRDPELKPDQTLSMLGVKIPGAYFLDLRDYKPAEAAAKLSIPILVLQGERDYQVRMADFEGWKKVLAGHKNAVLKSYPALTHLFIASGEPGSGLSTPQEYAKPGHVSEEVLDDLAAWIAAQGRPKAAAPARK